MFIVYSILDVYIGRTNNLKRRQQEHRRDFRNGKNKLFYNYLRDNNFTEEQIILTPLFYTKNKAESKQIEILFIILDKWGERKLQQRVPSISDR
jgi:hypothetical protein